MGIGPRSKPRAMHKKNAEDVPTIGGKNPSIMLKEEEEPPKWMGTEREQPIEALEVPITLSNDEPLTDFHNDMKCQGFDKILKHELRKEKEIMKHDLDGKNPLIFNNDSLISNDGMCLKKWRRKI
ncbi:hypothetical protein KI387_036696, partial [Taxus chinensis]